MQWKEVFLKEKKRCPAASSRGTVLCPALDENIEIA